MRRAWDNIARHDGADRRGADRASLSAAETLTAVRRLGIDASSEDARRMVALLDQSKDGRGLHSSTSQLNLSRVCRKKTPYTP